MTGREWLEDHGVAVCDDIGLRDALDAWAAMRDQRDQARAWAVALEQEVAELQRRIASGLSWIERRLDKWDSLTIEHLSIRDSLLGPDSIDAGCGATGGLTAARIADLLTGRTTRLPDEAAS